MSGRRVILTGAGSGQGRATALELAGAGFFVQAFDTDAEALGTLEAADDRIGGHVVDVTDFEAISDAVATVADKPGGFDGLLLCAGIHDRSTLSEGDPARWRKVLDVNLLGVLHCLRAGLPHLVERERADVVAWGSVSGSVCYPLEAVYAASKAAVAHLLECLRRELVETNVRVTVIRPGLVDTPMTRSSPGAAANLQRDPLVPTDIGRVVRFILEQPAHFNVTDIVLRPVHQLM
jgi:NADP-dependent 3-hydroxy acid dehydrogenase YdfG